MSDRTRRWIASQIKLFRASPQNVPALPFSELLSTSVVIEVLDDLGISFRERVYTPVITLWVFLSQVFSEDHSCREAVSRLIAFRLCRGLSPCSPDTNPYCQARKRLPEKLFKQLVHWTGCGTSQEVSPEWLFHDRHVKVVDGTTVSMPDTPGNQKEYPQQRTQRPGVGFPIARMVVVFSLACGTALEMAIGPCRGKQTTENALFRGLWDELDDRDIVLGDRHFCSYADISLLGQRGVDVVLRNHQRRPVDFRRGKRLGKDDHLVTWTKPLTCPQWMDQTTWAGLPSALTLRELRFNVTEPGRRTKQVVLITTLLEPREYTQEELASLYGVRWRAELDLRSLKTVLQMDVLRCKTPEMVRKEIWTHLLAYNLIRHVIAKAAEKHKLQPAQISFKGTLQTINAMREYLLAGYATEAYFHVLLDTIAYHQVGDRPHRYEPRARKRRPKPYQLLQVPRKVARKRGPGKTYD